MTAMEGYALWRDRELEDDALTEELAAVQGNESEIYERFYTDLKFGTAGLRGILGAGTNRMNIYTVRRATQGLALYIARREPEGSVAIAYDSRNNSRRFAEAAASVLAANGLRVHLYSELTPTPMLSWAVRYFGCAAGIVVTASHNPAEYNGYKVYGPDGCQMTSEAADEVLSLIEGLDIFRDVKTMPFEAARADGAVLDVTGRAVEEYYTAVLGCRLRPEVLPRSDLAIAYTPLNGAGNRPVRHILAAAGAKHVAVVPEQELPDGDFPTCRYPNPETPEAMALGVELARRIGSDILIGTDPDADRVGVAVRRGGEFVQLGGNEVGVLLADYIAQARVETGAMPERPVMIKSIVTTALTDLVAQSYGVEMLDVLTGFKYIGEQIGRLEQAGERERFVFAFEESCGYLPGTFVRDKDAVSTALLVAEMAAWNKARGRTLLDALEDIYRRFGYFYNHVSNTAFTGADGMKKMAGIMDALFASPPADLGGEPVAEYRDLRASVAVRGGCRRPVGLPPSDVLLLMLENGATVVIRPSGTEPKLKVYYMVKGPSMEEARRLADRLAVAVEGLLGLDR